MDRSCNVEVDRKVITPHMDTLLKALRDGPKIPDGWAVGRTDMEITDYKARHRNRTVSDLLVEWRRNAEITFICSFSGETHVVEDRTLEWTCPGCGYDHEDDLSEFEPDPDDWRDRHLDDMGD